MNRKHYVLIGAGSGITPLMSILRTMLNTEPNSKITLLFGNRSEESIIFKEQLATLRAKHADRLTVIHTLSKPSTGWTGSKGRISPELVKEVTDMAEADGMRKAEYFVCGPSEMMDMAVRTLKSLNIPAERVFEEHFAAPVTHPMEEGKSEPVGGNIEPSKEKVKIILEGEEKELTVTPDQSILDAALDADLDPPYACMIGSCCTCKAKLVAGKVIMDDREGLTDSEIADGYILTCQSHPVVAGCVVNYDL